MTQYITFNPLLTLKPDKGRALLMASMPGRNLLKDYEDNFTNLVHPIYAMILSVVDGRGREECVDEAATMLGVEKELVEKFVDRLTDNPSAVSLKFKDTATVFPPHTIVTIDKSRQNRRYSPELFDYDEPDLTMKRHLTPSSVTLMVNNVCVTDCIYCYQDKRRTAHCEIPFERIRELIDEASRLHVNTFDVIGGEFFLYPRWRELLKELRDHGYNPYLSTKVPLGEDDVRFLAEIGVKDMQVSVDTFIEDHLKASLRTKEGYGDKIKRSLELLDRYGIEVMIHTVLTRYNDTRDDMASIYDFIRERSNIEHWHVVKGDASLYPKADYATIEIACERINDLTDYLTEIKETAPFQIITPEKVIEGPVPEPTFESDMAAFSRRSLCSGLYSSLYILPDGDVTMCEQLYWNKRFIVGNVISQSLEEIWNSPAATGLYFIRQEDIPADSLCHTCKDFASCRDVRQVCYREIIRKYGADKWYYPDTSCPYAKKYKQKAE